MKSCFGLSKMLFFRIVFVLYFFKLSGISSFWKTAIIHFFRERGEEYQHNVGIIIGGGLLNNDA